MCSRHNTHVFSFQIRLANESRAQWLLMHSLITILLYLIAFVSVKPFVQIEIGLSAKITLRIISYFSCARTRKYNQIK